MLAYLANMTPETIIFSVGGMTLLGQQILDFVTKN